MQFIGTSLLSIFDVQTSVFTTYATFKITCFLSKRSSKSSLVINSKGGKIYQKIIFHKCFYFRKILYLCQK